MRVAIISDVHGNLEALREVLADLDQSSVDAAVCLGDNVGYGPDPEEVVRVTRDRGIMTIMGNHELGLIDSSWLDWFNPPTRRSLLRTRELVSEDTLRYISGLQPTVTAHGALFVHGAPPDSITQYLFELSGPQLRQRISHMKHRLCFVGHTHQLEIVGSDGKRVGFSPLRRGAFSLEEKWRYIVNVGSVGQPRDGDNNAKYVIWDDSAGSVEVRFVPYDIASTARKILELGFPEFNAKRLW